MTDPLRRLVVLAAAWSLGSTAALAIGLGAYGGVAGLAAAALAYRLTAGLPRRRGPTKYWRGRPVDDRWS